MRVYQNALPDPLYRLGYSGSVWVLPDWKYGPFTGRWDDPDGSYRVRYVAFDRRGAFVERMIRYRPDLPTLASLASIPGAASVPVPGIPDDWFGNNGVGAATIDSLGWGVADLASAEGISAAHPAVAAAIRATGRAVVDYDASTLLSATPREFTQAMSRYAYETGFDGILYRSRFGPELICGALFEGRHQVRNDVEAAVARNDADLRYACDVHHLPYPNC